MSNQTEKGNKIDLGLALLSVLLLPGEWLTLDDIAAWCDCSRERIRQIEESALRKVRRRLTPEEIESCGLFSGQSEERHVQIGYGRKRIHSYEG